MVRERRRFYIVDEASSRIRVWDVARLTTVADVALTQQPLDIAITPDGSSVWVAVPGAQAAVVIDTTTLAVATIPVGMSPGGIAITPDGQRALVAGDGTSMVILDVPTRTNIGSIPLSGAGGHVAVHPNGNTAYVSLPLTGHVSVVNLTDGTEAATIYISYEPHGLAVRPDGSEVYVTGRPSNPIGSAVFVINTAMNNVVEAITGTGLAADVKFNRDGRGPMSRG